MAKTLAFCASLEDLTRTRGAVLVANGGFGLDDATINARAVSFSAMGLALANAAKHELVGLLAEQLKPLNVYVGEVMVLGAVKSSPWDDGIAKLDATTVADALYDLFSSRSGVTRNVS